MNPLRISSFLSRRKVTIAIASSALLFVGITANAVNPPGTISNATEGVQFLCVNIKTASLSDGGIGKKANCKSGSYGIAIDTEKPGPTTPSFVFCVSAKTLAISYGGNGKGSNYSNCGTGYRRIVIGSIKSQADSPIDVHFICLGSSNPSYGGFGKTQKCLTPISWYGILPTKSNSSINSELGYLMCADMATFVVTHPLMGSLGNCGRNGVSFFVSAKGKDGLMGATGLSGIDGKDGKTLWNGIKDPEITWGAPGDMYINATTNTLFGPKNLDGTWPAGVSMVGPKGDQGPIGLTGATGPQGPGGSGPAGATGPAGVAGANGSAGIGVINTVMSNFDEIVKIDNSLAGNIWDRGNQKLRITFDVKNRTDTNLVIVPFENMTLQLWVNYFDASGAKMDDLDEPVLTWEQTPAGQTILPFGQKTFEVIVDNTSNFASLPAGATYFSLTFRGQNLTLDGSWNTYFGNGINGKYGTVVSFAASKYWD